MIRQKQVTSHYLVSREPRSGPPLFRVQKVEPEQPLPDGLLFGSLTDAHAVIPYSNREECRLPDFPNAIEMPTNPGIRRTLTLTTDNPVDRLFYRAAVADKIEADKDGWFRINEWRMRIESEATPVIRRVGNKSELLVPVRFKGNSAKIVQEYVW